MLPLLSAAVSRRTAILLSLRCLFFRSPWQLSALWPLPEASSNGFFPYRDMRGCGYSPNQTATVPHGILSAKPSLRNANKRLQRAPLANWWGKERSSAAANAAKEGCKLAIKVSNSPHRRIHHRKGSPYRDRRVRPLRLLLPLNSSLMAAPNVRRHLTLLLALFMLEPVEAAHRVRDRTSLFRTFFSFSPEVKALMLVRWVAA